MKTFNFNIKSGNIFLLTFFFLFSTSGFSQGIDFKKDNWEKILAMAKAQKKPIFLDAYASWCGPCKWMDKNIFNEAQAGDFYNQHFISAKIDMEKGEGIALAKKYGVRAYPTMLFINADGSVEHRICGSMQMEAFLELGNIALDPERRLKEAALNFKSSKKYSPEQAGSYFSMLEEGCASLNEDVNTYFSRVQGEELMLRANWELMKKFVRDNKSTAFAELLERRDEFAKNFGEDAVSSKIKEVYTASLDAAAREKDTTVFHKLKKEVVKNVGDESEELILQAEMTRARRANNWNQYATYANKYIEMYAGKNWQKLNEVAWTFYEKLNDKTNLMEAEDYARRSIEINPEYSNMDTYAWVLFKNGKMNEARDVAKRAIELGQEKGVDTSETEAIFEKLK